MATIAQLRNRALKKLRVLEEGETPTNEVIADVLAAYTSLHDRLSKDGAITWDFDEDIPSEAERPMVAILAAEMADDFGVDEMRYQRLLAESTRARGDLYMTQNNYISTETEAEYY